MLLHAEGLWKGFSALPLAASRKHQALANFFYLSFPSKNIVFPV